MSKSYRDTYAGWGEYRKERSRLKDFEDWKQDWKEERVRELDSVYVIVNEWTDIANNTSSEIVNAKWYRNEPDAQYALGLLAEPHGVELTDDDTSFTLEDQAGLQSDEYRIEELDRG